MHFVIVTTLLLVPGAIKSAFNHMSPEFKRVTAHEQIPLKVLRMRSRSQLHYGFNVLCNHTCLILLAQHNFSRIFIFTKYNTSITGILNCQK